MVVEPVPAPAAAAAGMLPQAVRVPRRETSLVLAAMRCGMLPAVKSPGPSLAEQGRHNRLGGAGARPCTRHRSGRGPHRARPAHRRRGHRRDRRRRHPADADARGARRRRRRHPDLQPRDRGAGGGRRQHRLVHGAVAGKFARGRLSRSADRPRGVRRAAGDRRLGTARRPDQSAGGRRRLPRHRQMAVRQRQRQRHLDGRAFAGL